MASGETEGSDWEYDAPQFIDFQKTGGEEEMDDKADQWFNYDHENDTPVSLYDEEPEASDGEMEEAKDDIVEQTEDSNEVAAAETPKIKRERSDVFSTPPETKDIKDENISEEDPVEEQEDVADVTEEQSKPNVPSVPANIPDNICTSLAEWRAKTKGAKLKHGANPIKSKINSAQSSIKDKSAPVQNKKVEQSPPNKKRRSNVTRSNSIVDTPSRNTRSRANPSKQANSAEPAKRKKSTDSLHHRSRLSRGSTPGSPKNQRNRPSSKEKAPRPVQKMTIPATPSFMKRAPISSNNKVKASEQLEMEKIVQMRQELAKKRKLAEKSHKRAQCSSGYAPVRAEHNHLTKPDEFHFATDERIKAQAKHETKDVDFTRQLRQPSASPARKEAPRLTKPQPFHLSGNRKRKSQGENGRYVSDAEKVIKFHARTPDRFRSRPTKDAAPIRGRSRSPPGLTVPKTPNITKASRKRTSHVISQAEKDEQELEEIQKNQFKAHPVNQKILNHANIGVPKIQPKEVTQPEEFDLEGARRKPTAPEPEEPHFEFHAQPIPAKILEKPTGLKPAKHQPLTVPESPAFALKNRIRPTLIKPEEIPEVKCIKAHPVPHGGIAFQPKIEHKHTVIEPFTFEERDKCKQKQKEEKIQQILEEEKRAREFKAQLLPPLSPNQGVPEKRPKPPTEPEPFHMEVDNRGAKKAEEWSKQMEEELKQQREFKANPAKVTQCKPFVPMKSTKPLTELNEFDLNTERRAGQREEYEIHKKERDQEAAMIEHARDVQRKAEEEEAIAKLRQELVHKTNPIRKYKRVEVHPSDKPLTEAESPRFSERLKKKVRT
ncbi:unnamed protein product [Owenia fusiformis]|uniref:Uncharacterized protein n=1 Tax=Owenia fusiformis TaxID=6347 RepID=A0A8J1URI7_OWEFU|nr:unnamed protein product [Owenia fusiformis]